jgi:hypothetical protein
LRSAAAFSALSRSMTAICRERMCSSRASCPTPTAIIIMYMIRMISSPTSEAVPCHVTKYAMEYMNA